MGEMLKTYTLEDAAEVLHMARRTVYKYVVDGRIRANKFGKMWLISADEMEYIIANGLRKPTDK